MLLNIVKQFMIGMVKVSKGAKIRNRYNQVPHLKSLFWSVKNSGEIFNNFKSKGFLASSLSTYEFCTLNTTYLII